MYDRHNPIIKWYEYDHKKLYKTAEAEDITQPAGGPAGDADKEEVLTDSSDASQPSGGPTGDTAMDDEVARIMAQFADAKQNSVDDVFAMMAAEVNGSDSGGDASEEDDQEALLASLLKPKQNTVDDLVAKAREGS